MLMAERFCFDLECGGLTPLWIVFTDVLQILKKKKRRQAGALQNDRKP